MHFLHLKFTYVVVLCMLIIVPAFGQVDTSFPQKELTAQSKFIEKHQGSKVDIEAYIETYLASAIQAKNANHEAKAYYYLCRLHRKKKNAERAHYFIDKAISIAKQKNDSYSLGLFLHRKGTVFYATAKNEQALKYYLKAYEYLHTKETPVEKLLNLRYDIATIKLKAKHYSEALTRFKSIAKSYDSLFKRPNNAGKHHKPFVSVLATLADTYTEQGFLKEAMDAYEKALHISITFDYTFGTYVSLGGKGKVLNHQKEYDKALTVINESIQMATTDTLAKGVIPFLYAHKGESYFGLKEYKNAILNFKKTDSIVKADNLNFIELDYVLKLIAASYRALEDYEKSSFYFYAHADKSDLNEKERIKLRETIFNDFELNNISKELETIKEEKGVFKNWFYFSVFIILCVSIIFVITVFYYKRKQRNTKEKFDKLIASISTKEVAKSNKKNFVISDETSQEILEKLDDFETSLAFLDNKYNLAILAKQCNTNSNYLSKIINHHKQKSFSQYLTDLRINYIIRELKNNKKLRAYTIQAIAEEIGFNKAEAFSKAFKKKTGFNPSYYIKNLETI
ncbi:MAG: helix-turn-helix domain-containing protein [Kordia sp.]|nr:helix-turn-helix domain-containing protein [Kordia sp.]